MRSDPRIPAGEFKAKCLAVLDKVAATGRPVVVTKRGRPVARVVPIPPENGPSTLVGSVTYHGDIVAPLGEAWDVES